ncbi:MAG: biopolymer transporter ExbD [Bacteroidetes bacterium]|nr:biopolymer transporter ExbD [Bacteroidota bacterium]
MSKFKKKAEVKQEIPTSSMPDVVFMLLFFFMVTTEMRKSSIEVKQQIPKAAQLRKLERKTLVANLYIGQPTEAKFGTEEKIQANDAFISTEDIIRWVNEEKSKLAEAEREQLTIAIKGDKDAKRGIIADVETELRKGNARKVLYTAADNSNARKN